MRLVFGALLFLVLSLGSVQAFAGEGSLTIWPLVDYRYSETASYRSLSLLGPLVKYERKGEEREYSLRPLLFHAADEGANGYTELLYPVATQKTGPDLTFFQTFHLLSYDFGPEEKGGQNEFLLFPFIFYGQSPEKGKYFAFFPFGGRIYDFFGQDEVRFNLFPLHTKITKGETVKTSYLWPVFGTVRGPQESGFKVWPIYGQSRKEGVYRKQFFIWPLAYSQDLHLDREEPVRRRGVFPLYMSEITPKRATFTYLWPFFSHTRDDQKDYREWNFPWPLLRVSSGEYRRGFRFLPFFSNEYKGAAHMRWYGWPIYKIEEIETEIFVRRRSRVLFFLYSNMTETILEEGTPRKRRIAFWPLFTYERIKGVSTFFTLSVLEPFFPANDSVRRSWSPLWQLYKRKWDKQGNEVSSLLWNLYWKERRGSDLAMELFPAFDLRSRDGVIGELKILKGLVRYRRGDDGKHLRMFFVPWEISWGGASGATAMAKTVEIGR